MRILLEGKGLTFEERDMSLEAVRVELPEIYHTHNSPNLVILTPPGAEVIEGFDPDRLDRFLSVA